MKKIIKYIVLLALLFEVNACNEPFPTELITVEQPTDNLNLEVASPEPADFVYSNGYDSTGVTDVVPQNENYILLSGVKYTSDNTTFETGIATAIFFDHRMKMINHSGRTVGFMSRYIGPVKFDNDSAIVTPARMKIMDNGVQIDTVIGLKYILRYRDESHINRTPFPYNSDVNVKISPMMGRPVQFFLPVPKEITGSVGVLGKRSQRNLSLNLKWNADDTGKIEIILGGIPKGKTGVFPLLKFKAQDNGEFKIPSRYIQSVPFDKFDNIVVTFIRKREKKITNTHTLTDNFIAAQSIHNIIFKIQ